MGKQLSQIWGMALFLTIACATMIVITVFLLLRASIVLPLLGAVVMAVPAAGKPTVARSPSARVVIQRATLPGQASA